MTLNLPDGRPESEDVWISSMGVRYCSHCGALLSDPLQEFGDYGPHGDEGCDICDPGGGEPEEWLRENEYEDRF